MHTDTCDDIAVPKQLYRKGLLRNGGGQWNMKPQTDSANAPCSADLIYLDGSDAFVIFTYDTLLLKESSKPRTRTQNLPMPYILYLFCYCVLRDHVALHYVCKQEIHQLPQPWIGWKDELFTSSEGFIRKNRALTHYSFQWGNCPFPISHVALYKTYRQIQVRVSFRVLGQGEPMYRTPGAGG